MKRRANARQVQRGGLVRWRVIIPADLNNGKVGAARFFETKADAADFARNLEEQRNGNTNDLVLLPAVTQAAVVRALKRLDNDARRLEEAVDHYLRTRPQITGRAVEAVVSELLASKEAAGLRKRSLQALKSTLGRFAGAHAGRPIETILAEEIEHWLLSTGWAPGTRRGYLIDIRSLFSHALKRGYVSSNVALNVDKPETESGPPGILGVPEAARLLRSVMDHDVRLAPCVALVLFGGLRPDEAPHIGWEHVHQDGGEIEVPAVVGKNRQRRFVELNPTLAAWLALGGDLPVINLRKRMERVRRLTAGPGAEPIAWPHDCLRHSFCSYGYAVRGPAWVCQQADHSEAILRKHYRHGVRKPAAEAFWALTPVNLNAVAEVMRRTAAG